MSYSRNILNPMPNFQVTRDKMIKCQLRPSGICEESLLHAFSHVARENFLPENLKGIAYIDDALEVHQNRFFLSPLNLARMIQLLDVQPHHTVLDVGCTTGYSSVILAYLSEHVLGIDSDPSCIKKAQEITAQIPLGDLSFKTVDSLAKGALSNAPFDRILIQGAVTHVPPTLLKQLAPHGRLITIIRSNGHQGKITVFTPQEQQFCAQILGDGSAPFLDDFEEEAPFSF